MSKNKAKDTKDASSIWGGRFAEGPSALMEAINASIDYDKRLYAQDIQGSKAHATMLADAGISAAVVSVPCLDLFFMQDASYRNGILGTAPRIAIEAGLQQGWGRLLGDHGVFIGMTGFGASAPIDDLYNHFGITADAVVAAAKDQLG